MGLRFSIKPTLSAVYTPISGFALSLLSISSDSRTLQYLAEIIDQCQEIQIRVEMYFSREAVYKIQFIALQILFWTGDAYSYQSRNVKVLRNDMKNPLNVQIFPGWSFPSWGNCGDNRKFLTWTSETEAALAISTCRYYFSLQQLLLRLFSI